MTVPPTKPFSPAAERNRDAILTVLRQHLTIPAHPERQPLRVLEVGSGTGQHAVHFAGSLPYVLWQCSDVAEHLAGIRAWLSEAGLSNTPPPWELDVNVGLPTVAYEAVFTANTLHILGWAEVQRLFAELPRALARGGLLVVYGPFNVGGQFTSTGNATFDAALRADDPKRGIRDLEAVDSLAQAAGLAMVADVSMPANNRCIVWRRQA
jgi:SAM-dependent methyltransferase